MAITTTNENRTTVRGLGEIAVAFAQAQENQAQVEPSI